jgi:putative phage-type endonuclease
VIRKVKTEGYEDWKALRGKYIGGSDAAAVVGMNPWKSAYALWAEKSGKLPGFEGNLATEVGTFLEEFVAQKFAEVTGKKVRKCNVSWFNDRYPWAIANIDREIVGEDAGLEIKTTSEMNLKKFKGGEYPANYYCQCVHYMAVTGKKKWYLAVLVGNREFYWFEIQRDEEEIAALMAAEEAFWGHVKSGVPPLADGSESTAGTLYTLYPDSTEDGVGIGQYESDLEQLMRLKERKAEIETDIAAIENRVKACLGHCGYGEGERFYVTWKSQSRNTFDHKKFMQQHPEIDVSGYWKESKSRPFKVAMRKEKK